ncbi:NAD(P)-dependent oxidoreductase [Pseudoflavonifractor sp. 524-17]|nr:NAD(P)-dependent oxidoreductase [Pseudoflavonifractor sp. 524-17]NCE65352.1 NAD(P)-dependent oxidoreductase [Pseudoflavonifractor sp. 524-17]
MEVLLIGNGRLVEALIDRLNKNGDRVYLLTGQRESRHLRQRVFEKYNFSYDNDSVKDIYDSIKPDITIFAGAWDSHFNWQKARQESVRYTAALINILTAYSMLGRGRFIYFSSQEVFSGSFPQNLPESWKPAPKNLRSMAIAQGEEICANYRQNQGLDIRILRLDHLYCVPEKGRPEADPCGVMCMQALKSGKIFASDRDVFSMLFVKDAAELSYKAIAAPELAQPVYHISAMEEINGVELAELIQDAMGKGVEVVEESVGEVHRVVLDGSAFAEKLGQKIFTHYPEGVKQVAQFMKRHRESFIQAEDAGGSWAARLLHRVRVILAALVPYVENILCFVGVFFLNHYTAGNGFFDRVDFFLLYVLLFAVTLGQRQAVLSGLLASAGYCLQQMYYRSGFEVLLDFNLYVWMAQIFIVGMVVGYIKDQLHTIKQESQDEIAYLENRLEDLTEINDSNVRMKENFEVQLVNQKDSLGKIYDITSILERQAPEEVLFTAVQTLAQLMECGGAAIYTVANRDYARLFSSISREARSLGNSIKYSAMTEMYRELKERRVFINKTMQEKLPLMASAVYSGEEMQLIFMLWGIPWQRMTMAEANRLAVIGQMVQSAVVRATRYLDALSSQRYVDGTRLMAGDAFRQLAGAFLRARDQGLTECALLEIPVSGKSRSAVVSALSEGIRQSDYMGSDGGDTVYILLSNTNEENAGLVMERFRAAGYNSSLLKEVAL